MVSHGTAVQFDFGAPAVGRISNLPINVLHLILERLPLHVAARTSILSKTWRSIWELQVELVFDEVFFSHLVSKTHKQAQASEVSATISNILLVHSGPLLKFHLSVPLNLPLLHLDRWIKNISNRGVKILNFFNNPQTPYRMPSYFFSCTELTHLTLDNCILNPPLRFEGFCNLISVRLLDVKITADMSFGTKLETLDLKYCTGIKHLGGQFKCNNSIRKLMIADCEDINWRWFECTKKVVILGLMFEERSNSRRNIIYLDMFLGLMSRIINLDKVFGNMPKIEVLLLNGLFLKYLGPGASVLKSLTTPMENLIFLQLFHFGFYDLGQIQSFFCLIRSSPNLQNLHLRLEPKFKPDGLTASRVEEYLQLPNFVDMILDRIETINILEMGTVLVFQPAEEGGGGAKRIVDAGILKNVKAIFGLHVSPGLPIGKVSSRPGPLLAGTGFFEAVISGKGGHAALPHHSIDPILAASDVVVSLQHLVSREADPLDSQQLSGLLFEVEF